MARFTGRNPERPTGRRGLCRALAERQAEAGTARERNDCHSRRKRNEGGRVPLCLDRRQGDYLNVYCSSENRKTAAFEKACR